jgi:hypothetical protein
MAHRPKVVIRDRLGRFMSLADRYKPDVAMIQTVRNKRYTIVAERPLPPEDLINVLSQREFESLPEALIDVKDYTSKAKYKAWDIASQIDKTKGIRRKQLKVTVSVRDGRRLKTVIFYHKVKRNTASSYAIFRRINQEIGLEGFYLYDRVAGKILADRTGRQVRLEKVKVEEII